MVKTWKEIIPETDEWVILKVSAKGIKHINKNGVLNSLQKAYNKGIIY